MQTIRAGELYFLKSPFHADDYDTDKEKRVSYLLGTVSARPAVVIRPPYHWDSFSMVTVIPALSRGNPAIVYHLRDRYDRETKSDYPFVPHHAISIPVSRLGRYIGSLEDHELEELMYAFHWIMDPSMQKDPAHPAPRAYKDVVRNKIPKGSWIAPKDQRSDVSIRIAKNGELRSDTNPEINGVKVIDESGTIYPRVEKAIKREPVFVPVSNPLPDSVDHKPDEVVVPVEKEFPPSIFSNDVLQQVAGRFDIDCAYYLNAVKRTPDVIDPDKDGIRHNLKDREIQEIFDYYKMMKPMDAYLLGPRLPTFILAEITGMDSAKATVLKLMCNILRDMPKDEYAARLDALKQPEPVKEEKKPEPPAPVDYKPIIQKLKPYMSSSRIMSIPENLREDFLSLPKGIVKRAWTGTQFETAYKKALATYREGVA